MGAFVKEEKIAFDMAIAKFADLNIASNVIKTAKFDAVTVARSQNDQIYRPVPMIVRSFSGSDQTGNFSQLTQLSVPARIDRKRVVPIEFDPDELLDMDRMTQAIEAAKNRLAADIETDVLDMCVNQGTRVLKSTVAASGFADTIPASVLFDDVGIPAADRVYMYNSLDYQNAVSGLASRQTFAGDVQRAYVEGNNTAKINGFSLYQVPRMPTLAAATATGVTVNGANQYYTPTAIAANQLTDYRYQNLTVAVTSSTIKVGDCFTIAGVFDRSMISKQVLPQLKTFRVISIVSGAGGSGVIQISPPIISAGGSTAAEFQYQNASATPASGAAITFLNTVSRQVCPFFYKDAFELLPGMSFVPQQGEAVGVMTATLGKGGNGLRISMLKAADINTSKYKMRMEVRYGVVCTAPEMAGIGLFSQT